MAFEKGAQRAENQLEKINENRHAIQQHVLLELLKLKITSTSKEPTYTYQSIRNPVLLDYS